MKLYKKIENDVLIVIRKQGYWEYNVNVDLYIVIVIDYLKIIYVDLIFWRKAKRNCRSRI